MKIASVKPVGVGTAWRNYMFLEVETDDGLVGVGECTLPNVGPGLAEYLIDFARRHVIGADPFDTESLWQRMHTGDFTRRGAMHMAGLSGIDIAVHDIIAQALGVPLYKLIGGAMRDRVQAYANAWYTVERDPSAIATRATQAVLPLGYTALKIDPFGAGRRELTRDEFLRSIEIIEALRSAVGPEVEIFVEGHARFTTNTAIRVARALEPFDPGWFEEPTPWDDYRAWAEVRRATSVPIAGGEHFHTRYEYLDPFERRCMDIAQADITLVGGFTEMRKLAAMADVYGMLIAPHNSQGPICNTATAHFSLTCPNFKIQECFDDFIDPVLKKVCRGCLQVKHGWIGRPTAPGLGISLDLDVAKAHPLKPVHFDLWSKGWERRDG